jgi:hypothetical protein
MLAEISNVAIVSYAHHLMMKLCMYCHYYFPTLTVSRKTFAIAIFQQIAAFVELAAERAAGTNNFIRTVSTNLSQVRISPESIGRVSSAQSFIIEITDKMIVVQIKSLQDWQICNPQRNGSS